MREDRLQGLCWLALSRRDTRLFTIFFAKTTPPTFSGRFTRLFRVQILDWNRRRIAFSARLPQPDAWPFAILSDGLDAGRLEASAGRPPAAVRIGEVVPSCT